MSIFYVILLPNTYKTANNYFEDEKILQDKKAIVNTFKNYFTGLTHSLWLKMENIALESTPLKIVKNFRNIEYLKNIKNSQQAVQNSSFSFQVISEEEIKNYIIDLLINKTAISSDIPTKILKQHAQMYLKKLTDIFNENGQISWAEVAPVYEKYDLNDKQNYRPVIT